MRRLKIEEVNIYRFKFKLSQENYERICNNYAYKFISLDRDSTIMLEDISSYNKTEIRVSGISLDITEDEVRTIFVSNKLSESESSSIALLPVPVCFLHSRILCLRSPHPLQVVGCHVYKYLLWIL